MDKAPVTTTCEAVQSNVQWGAGISTAVLFGVFVGGLITAPVGSWALKKPVVTYVGLGLAGGGVIGALASAALFAAADSDTVRDYCVREDRDASALPRDQERG